MTGQIVKDGQFFRARLEVGKDSRTGKPIYATARCKTRPEAKDALAKMITDKSLGDEQPIERGNFGQFLDQWLELVIKPTKKPNTYTQYEWLVRFHIKPHLGSKQTDKITRADIQALLLAKSGQQLTPKDKAGKNARERTLSGNTLRLIRACLQSAFEEAKKNSQTRKNPAEGVALPNTERESKKQFLTPQETAKFIEKLDQCDLADLFAFMIATGARVGEASAIRWEDVDLSVPNRPIVWIRGQLQRADKKLVYVKGTKTNKERCLPLTPNVADRIKALDQKRMQREAQRLLENETTKKPTPAEDPDGIIFLNVEGRRLDRKHVLTRLHELCKEAGIPEISPHKLRHTAATIFLAETGDLHGVQKMLGHSQVSLTSDLYGHATAETLRHLSNAMEKTLAPLAPKQCDD